MYLQNLSMETYSELTCLRNGASGELFVNTVLNLRVLDQLSDYRLLNLTARDLRWLQGKRACTESWPSPLLRIEMVRGNCAIKHVLPSERTAV
jgi:hypothetical protein